MGQNFRPRFAFHTFVLVCGLLYLLRCSIPSVVHSQTKPGTPSAPPATVSVIEVSPKTYPLYTEYTGTTDSLDTVEIRAQVDGYIEQKRFHGGQTVKVRDLLYVLDQSTFIADVQKAKAAVAKAEADLRFAKEGVEVLRAESKLAQSRAALIKTEKDVARYTPLVKEQAASQQDLDTSVARRDVAREEVAALHAGDGGRIDRPRLDAASRAALSRATVAAAPNRAPSPVAQ